MKNWLTLILAAAFAPFGSMASGLPGFDFAYEIGGDRKVAPIQVFDDGHHTYLQWPTAFVLPSVTVTLNGKRVSPIAGSSPYFVVAGVGSQLEIRGGAIVARVTYVGERGKAPMQVAQAAAPVFEREKASLAAASKAREISQWTVEKTDKSIDGAVSRWAKTAGYSLTWKVADEMLIDRGGIYRGSLNEALSQLAREIGLSVSIEGTAITVSESNP